MKTRIYKPRRRRDPVRITREEIEEAMKSYEGEITILESRLTDENFHPAQPVRR